MLDENYWKGILINSPIHFELGDINTLAEYLTEVSHGAKPTVGSSLPPPKIDKLLKMQIEECRIYIDRRSRDFGQSSYELKEWFDEIKPVDWRQKELTNKA